MFVKSKDRQTLIDIAVSSCGDVESVFKIAETNNISITEELSLGKNIYVPEPSNKRVVEYFKNNAIVPATDSAISEEIEIYSNDNNCAIISNDEQYRLTINNY